MRIPQRGFLRESSTSNNIKEPLGSRLCDIFSESLKSVLRGVKESPDMELLCDMIWDPSEWFLRWDINSGPPDRALRWDIFCDISLIIWDTLLWGPPDPALRWDTEYSLGFSCDDDGLLNGILTGCAGGSMACSSSDSFMISMFGDSILSQYDADLLTNTIDMNNGKWNCNRKQWICRRLLRPVISVYNLHLYTGWMYNHCHILDIGIDYCYELIGLKYILFCFVLVYNTS